MYQQYLFMLDNIYWSERLQVLKLLDTYTWLVLKPESYL